LDAGVIFQTRSGEQVLELAPWNDDLVLGPIAVDAATTQESMGGSGSDTNSLLSELAAIFSWQSLDRSCVRYAFTGWQVQAAESDRAAAFPQSAKPMIIDHGRVGGPRGLISVACSKWAYYRTAAALALDTAGLCLKRPATPKCNTQAEPLFGGNMPALAVFIDQVSNAARNYSLSDAQVGHLVGLYGTKSQEIFQWLKNTPELRETICSHQPDIKAQLVYGVEKEMAVTLGDIFLRRTVIGQTGCQGLDCAPAAAATLARHLNWSEARVRVEIDNYHRELESTYRK
jgi:glycerol-3-phosphate dehydrogenase